MATNEINLTSITKVLDIRSMPEETKSVMNNLPQITTALQLGEYIFNNKRTFPQDLLTLTEEKNIIDSLSLKHVRFSTEAVRHLAVVLPFLKQITSADFTDMLLQPEDFEILSPSIGKLINLKDLALTGNQMKEGSKYLVKPLQNLKNLEVLDLTDCCIDAIGITVLCEGLCCLNQLILINLSMNPIGDEGAQALSKIMNTMPLLAQIEMFSCEITDAGGRFLENGFKTLMLESVLLGNNKFTPGFETKMKRKFPFVHFGIKHYKCLVF